MNMEAELHDQADALIEKTRGLSFTEYQIVGELREVLQAIKTIFINYDPQGYGTQVKLMRQVGDKYEARVWRANSCD
jgi:hypothetical protein